jgi:hypothetical protein
MAIDAQIPLSATQPQSFAKQAGDVYQLAGAMEKQQEVQEQHKDRQAIQQYLKEGGNLTTPDGLAKAAEWAKNNTSLNSYQTIVQAGQEAKTNEAKMQEYYAKMPKEIIEGEAAQTQAIAQHLETGITQYENDVKEVGQQEADRRYMEMKGKTLPLLAGQKIPGTDHPVFSPQMLQGYATTNAKQDQSGMMNMKYKQEQLMAAAKLQEELQKTKTEAALEGKYKREPAAGGGSGVPDSVSKSTLHGEEFLKQLSPGDQAQVKAVAEGRTQISDVSLRHRERISQLVNQYDPGFTSKSYAADKASAVAISKDLTAIRPYEQMLNKNADIAIDLSKKAIATDSRLANRSINWLKQNVGDNPDVAEFLAQTTIVQTEAARVLNNPRLVGQLSDSARKEMESVINGDMPLKSYERVIRRLQQDGKNRVKAMEDERAKVLKQIPKSDEAAAPSDKTNTGKSTVVPHETPPAKNKQGWTLHKDAKGNMAYVSPKGEIEEVK